MSNLASAVETAPVSSLHSFGSANPDDFAVPTGREEEWRFTPLNKLRKLHADAPLGSSGVTVSVEAAPELVVEVHESAERFRVSPRRHMLVCCRGQAEDGPRVRQPARCSCSWICSAASSTSGASARMPAMLLTTNFLAG